MEVAVLIALALLIVLLLSISFRIRHQTPPSRKGHAPGTEGSEEKDGHTCPLCGSRLKRGERVRSVFYPAPGDTLAEIHGCRFCHGPEASRERICPVCKEVVPSGGYVVARVFRRPDKTHIHVLGCTRCRPSA